MPGVGVGAGVGKTTMGTLLNQDADAKLIISTVGIVDKTRQKYTDEFIKEWKAAGFWERTKMLYAFPEGTAAQQKYNWKDLADTDAAGRLEFIADTVGAHTDGFYKGNGSDQWIRTHKNANIFANNDVSVIIYGEGSADSGIDVGLGSSFYIGLGYTAKIFAAINDAGTAISVAYPYNRKRVYTFSRNAINEFFVNVGNFQISDGAAGNNSGTNAATELAISAYNISGTLKNADKKGLVILMDGLSKPEAIIANNIVQKYLYYTKPADKIRQGYFRGDSNTVGIGASDEANKWVTKICTGRFIKENAGVNGSTVLDFKNAIANAWFGDGLTGLMTIGYGTNDIAQDIAANALYTVALFQERLDYCVNYLIESKNYTASKIAILSIPYQKALSAGNRTKALQYRDAAQVVATTYGCKFVELFESMEVVGNSLIVETDNVHFSDAGHEFVYQKVLAATA